MPLLKLLEKSVDTCFAVLPREKPEESLVTQAALIAHRGAHDIKQGIIENTEAAFTRAVQLGCWGIELDVHATADGVLVVNHDPTLKRLWKRPEAIGDWSFTQLRKHLPQVPSLAEVVARYGKQVHLFIELKAPFAAEAQLFETLRPLNAEEDYHLLSLDEPLFASFRRFPLKAQLLVAVHNNLGEFTKLCLQKNYGGVLGHYLLLTNQKINELRLAHKIVGVGMVDSKYSLYRELNRGINWIFSNNAEAVIPHLQPIRKPS